MKFAKFLTVSSIGLALGSATAFAQQQEFEARYFSQTSYAGELRSKSISTALLKDSDLIRGNNNGEVIVRSPSNSSGSPATPIFNGTLRYDLENFRVIRETGESLVDVYFNDGTVLDDVLAIRSDSLVYTVLTASFLLDQNALLNAGKTLNDIAEVSVNQAFDHNLNYSDLGFVPVGDLPPLNSDTDNSAETEVDNNQYNEIVGTHGRDNLKGTAGDDYIDGRGGSRDILTGNAGNDYFIFGTEAGNGAKDRDVVIDFNISDDTLVLENGASIASAKVRNGSLTIKLKGKDNDTIRLRKVSYSIDAIDIISVDGEFE